MSSTETKDRCPPENPFLTTGYLPREKRQAVPQRQQARAAPEVRDSAVGRPRAFGEQDDVGPLGEFPAAEGEARASNRSRSMGTVLPRRKAIVRFAGCAKK